MKNDIIVPMGADNVMRDESQYSGMAFSASFPTNAEQVCEIVLQCRDKGECITVHGSLTGINGAGVPNKGHSMNTSKLCAVEYDAEQNTIWAQAGATFSRIESTVRQKSGMTREFPASPTEKTATIGGALAFGAAGLRAFKVGNVAQYVLELEYCDNAGQIHRVKRGEEDFDLLLGSEGMCAIITAAKLSTAVIARAVWGFIFFFKTDERAADFADCVAEMKAVSVLEYIDRASFELVEEFKSSLSAISGLVGMPEGENAAIYLEMEAATEEEIEAAAEDLMEIAVENESDPDIAWTAVGDEVEVFRSLRHAVSECVNMVIARHHITDSKVKKLSMAIKFSDRNRGEILQYYRQQLENTALSYVIFGHLGSFSPYVNIIPTTASEYSRGKELAKAWCQEAFANGGCAFVECGVGKLYRDLYCETAPIEELNRKIKTKRRFDAENLFNPGNMFSDTIL